jgi:hypothetical protein
MDMDMAAAELLAAASWPASWAMSWAAADFSFLMGFLLWALVVFFCVIENQQ